MGKVCGVAAPRLGIFWFVQGPDGTPLFIECSAPVDEIPLIGGFRTLDTGHVDYWEDVKRSHPWLRDVPYEAFPRGRANYCESDDAWLLLLDRQLMRREFVDVVVRSWALPSERLKVMGDLHYKSTRPIGTPERAT